jgi:hypothetical protein
LHRRAFRLDRDLRRAAEPVRADRRHRQRRDHAQPVRLRRAAADLFDAFVTVARDADGAARVDHDEMERPLEMAALDEVADELGESLFIVRGHPTKVPERRKITAGTKGGVARRPHAAGPMEARREKGTKCRQPNNAEPMPRNTKCSELIRRIQPAEAPC